MDWLPLISCLQGFVGILWFIKIQKALVRLLAVEYKRNLTNFDIFLLQRMWKSAPLNPWIMSNGAGKSFIKFQPIFWFRKWSEKDVGRFCFFMQKLSDTLNFFLWKTDNIFKKDNRLIFSFCPCTGWSRSYRKSVL